jgi:uncharacterized membrane protein YccC
VASPNPLSPAVSWPAPTTASEPPFFAHGFARWRTAGQDALSDGLFSLKTLLAALLAYYIALSVQLERPFWSVITCYIVAQPLTGALLSKGVFRLIGTVIGASVAVLLVPNLVDAPELLVLALALWLGVCTYVAALDRTPRSYVSLLAGYSAIIVAVPTVNATDAIFDIATARVQEIGIGILCVSLVHALLFPRPVWHQVRDRLDRILEDAQLWSTDALAMPPRRDDVTLRDHRQLAGDLHDLHLLSVHLPYDMTSPAVVPAILRQAEMQLGLLLPLASAVENRIAALGNAGAAQLGPLIADVRDWIAGGAQQDATPLLARAQALEPALDAPVGWPDMLHLSLLDRLAGLIRAHASARHLRDGLLDEADTPEPDSANRRALHRDHRVALRASAATVLTVLVTSALWILSAWPEAGSAVVTAAIICALFSHLDTPMRAARNVVLGTVGSVVAAGVCAFVLIPQASDVVTLCLLISPFLLVLGWLLARPHRAPFGIGAVLSFPGLAGLDISYDSAFDSFANQAAAQVLGSLIACMVLLLVRSTGAASAARRLASAGWRELAAMTGPRMVPETSPWISRMLDRMVLLAPHLSALSDGDALTADRLRDIRIGMALDDLQRVGPDMRQSRRGALLNARLRANFVAAQKAGVLEAGEPLCRAIERALASANAMPASPAKRSLLLALVGLSRNLFPAP